ncbi:hypothetical protein E4U12_003333 [Claviceps purpurea]|nr:hypothetical protein E4U12_003333 [Claviceps purpurea]
MDASQDQDRERQGFGHDIGGDCPEEGATRKPGASTTPAGPAEIKGIWRLLQVQAEGTHRQRLPPEARSECCNPIDRSVEGDGSWGVGKRGGLREEDSPLGRCQEADMAVINLKKVLGGPQFLAKVLIDFNGYGLKLTALIDTGAGGYTFVNPRIAKPLKHRLQAPSEAYRGPPT